MNYFNKFMVKHDKRCTTIMPSFRSLQFYSVQTHKWTAIQHFDALCAMKVRHSLQ